MRRVYVALAGLLLLAVLVQFYFAAIGAFAEPQDDQSFDLHRIAGTLAIPVLSLLATLVAALARAPGRLIGLTVAPVGLVVLQLLITAIGRNLGGSTEDQTTPVALAFLGLHAINGLFILAVAGKVVRGARTFAGSPRTADSVAR